MQISKSLLLCKQGRHLQVLLPGKQGAKRYLRNCARCPDGCSVLGKQCTDPDLRAISAPARWEHLPNPEITLCVSCAFLQNAYFAFGQILEK